MIFKATCKQSKWDEIFFGEKERKKEAHIKKLLKWNKFFMKSTHFVGNFVLVL